MNILFHSNQLSERGTEVALFDYAAGNQHVLGNRSFIAAPKNRVLDNNVLIKFKQEFTLCLYESNKELNDFLEINNIDLVYKIVHGGKQEDIINDKIPHFIHCVFSTNAQHGTFYCPISSFLNRWYRTNYPVLPHIVRRFPGTKKNLRDELGIPKNAVVFGGYGGENSFNIPFVKDTIGKIARNSKDIFFLFMNFNSFADGGGIIFLPKNTDINYKETFINTCDAMIHARSDGETFGLAIAEFSIKNKPVITWAPNIFHNLKFCLRSFLKYIRHQGHIYASAHLDFLGKKAIRYTSEKDLTDIFLNFREKYLRQINYDCYSDRFNEERVMRMFEKIIIGSFNDK
ncbi:hypothetical protein FACS189476_04010 [Spirochaetia bacterium]|nr:hypothetical protein FACS189476_04010 [Spirochaetia bacterium]